MALAISFALALALVECVEVSIPLSSCSLGVARRGAGCGGLGLLLDHERQPHGVVSRRRLVIERAELHLVPHVNVGAQLLVALGVVVELRLHGNHLGCVVHGVPKDLHVTGLWGAFTDDLLVLHNLPLEQQPEAVQGLQVDNLPAILLGEVVEVVVHVELRVLGNGVDELAHLAVELEAVLVLDAKGAVVEVRAQLADEVGVEEHRLLVEDVIVRLDRLHGCSMERVKATTFGIQVDA